MRILFIEDHATFPELVSRKFLARHEVTIVPSLADARAELAGGEYELVLLDSELGDGNGIELMRELEGCPERPLIVAVSAYDDRNEALRHAGADATCSKLHFGQIEAVIASLTN